MLLRDQLLDPTAPWAQTMRDNLHHYLTARDLPSQEPSEFSSRYIIWHALGYPGPFSLWIGDQWDQFLRADHDCAKPRDCWMRGSDSKQDLFDEWLFDQLKEKYT